MERKRAIDGNKIKIHYFKCEKHQCTGRLHVEFDIKSETYRKPVKRTQEHNHLPNCERSQCLLIKQVVQSRSLQSKDCPRSIFVEATKGISEEVIAQMQRQDVQRQMVNNIRKEDAPWAGKDPDHIKDWIVPFVGFRHHVVLSNWLFYCNMKIIIKLKMYVNHNLFKD